MSGYIDADVLKEVMRPTIQGGKELADGYTFNDLWSVAENLINHIPTVDAVPVVRCKDCKYLEPTTINGKPFYPVCHVWDCLAVDDDGYCYRGERREHVEVTE